MTSKDFVLVAHACFRQKPVSYAIMLETERRMWLAMVDELCETFAINYPRFDRKKFKHICLKGIAP